ncbi:hypothetical protein LY76DRAFT_596273 [Colletotrichum caudatum]|nr:hypothetical protein LY76DRAFT_596273 [Colletotrichum caudatum]
MNRSRGFVSNYSSSLRDAGIDEGAFSTFINQLNRLAELKPRAQAIDFSGFAHLCSSTDQDVFMSMAVGMAFETAKGIQHSTAMNKLIDKTNNELFRPKGLVCLLMTWKPEGPTSSALDRAIRSRPVQVVKNERRGRAKRPKAKLSPSQGMGMFEWSQPTSIKRIDRDANFLSVTGITTNYNHYPMQNDDTESIPNRTSQLFAVNHPEDRHEPQVATVEIGVRARSQEGIPFQRVENSGLESLRSHGQITLGNLGGCSTPEEKDVSDCGPSSISSPAPIMSIGDVNEGHMKDSYSRKEFKGLDFFNSSLPPSFTTGALKALETETLYVLIANMPDDEEARRDTICE